MEIARSVPLKVTLLMMPHSVPADRATQPGLTDKITDQHHAQCLQVSE